MKMQKKQMNEQRPFVTSATVADSQLCRIAESAPVMIWISGLDKGCTYFNQRWLEFTGKRLEEELGGGWSRGVHPDDLKRCLQIYTDAFDRREEFTMEYRLRHHEGGYRWILDNGVPDYDTESAFTGFIGSCTDINDRFEASEYMRKSNERFNAFIKNSTEDLYCFEFEQPLDVTLSEDEQIDHFYKYGYVAEGNDAWAKSAGYERAKDVLGMRFEDILPRSVPESISTLKKLISMQYRLDNQETVEIYPTGVTRCVLNSVVGIRENGRLVRIWGTGRDITQQRQMEEELMRNEGDLQKLAGRLISSHEHELRRLSWELHDGLEQQLAVMAIEAGHLGEQYKDLSEPLRQKVAAIEDRLIKASEDVHTLARNLHPSILDDLGLVRAMESACRHFSACMGIAAIFKPKNVPQIIPENIALSLYRITQEGLANIAKHADTKNADIFLEGTPDSMVLTIRDTGVGFDPKAVRVKEGLGLGSMRERVRLVNGTLSITSSPGKGTTIEVTVPFQGAFND